MTVPGEWLGRCDNREQRNSSQTARSQYNIKAVAARVEIQMQRIKGSKLLTLQQSLVGVCPLLSAKAAGLVKGSGHGALNLHLHL